MYSNKTKSVEVDMTRPQPCVKYKDAAMMEWIAKLMEETDEVVQMSTIADCADENGMVDHDAYGIVNVKEKLSEELTDVITVCTSWLHALGYNEEERKELQRRINEKNKARGYW